MSRLCETHGEPWRRTAAAWVVAAVSVVGVAAEEHRVEATNSGPPQEGISAEVAGELGPTALHVIRGQKKSLCHLWFVKSLPTVAGFQRSDTVLYPLETGQLVGAFRFDTKGEDFRGQEIPRGLYTLRYAQQPVDGNHVGTSPTRDFFLLLPAELDVSPVRLDEKQLVALSTKASGTSHPAMLALVAEEPGDPGDAPRALHEEDRDLWSVQYTAATPQGPLVMRLVVAGHVEM